MTEPKLKENRWGKEIELQLLKQWEKDYDFSFNADTEKEIFAIDNPPPYPSGSPHPGQMVHYNVIDMFARSRRMMGYEVLIPMCLDRNGVNIERTVEKKTGKTIHQFDRATFIEMCKKEIEVYGNQINDIFIRTGCTFDKSQMYMTDSDEYRAVSQAAFIEMWNNGLIVEQLRPNIYCPHDKTTLAEADVLFEDKATKLNDLAFSIKETKEQLVIATTRPELLCACRAILVHPDDERYKHLHGKHAVLPIYGRDVPIYPHTYAKPEFGSGVVMVCSYGDTGDIQIFRELQLEPIAAIDENARMTEAAGKYKGLTTKQAREAIINDLRDAGLLLKQTDLVHSTPICERCNTPVEYISLKEWYIKQLEFLDDVKRVANKIKFHPQKNKQILLDWIDSITIDWPISRRRYYHTEIPLWYCKKCGKALVPKPGKYYRPWRDPAPFDKCPKCGGTEFKGEEKVFDTWVDSSISNLYVCGYKRNDALFEKAYPTALRPQGREIVRTWLYYSLLRNKQLMNEPAFKDVVITGLGLAEDGKKMSKSKGNYVEPMPIIEEVGADAWRLWGAGEVTTGDDFRMSKERMLGASKFLTKLWNVARFISSFEDAPRPKKLNDTDAWILAECNKMARKAIEGYEEYNLSAPAWAVRDFIWNIFASHYVEMAKARAYEGDASALYTLHECLRNTLKILAPISPFITDKVYKELYNGKIHYEEFSKPSRDKKHVELTEKVIEFNSMVWKKKKDANLSLRADLTGVPVPDELKPFAADLIKMHNLK